MVPLGAAFLMGVVPFADAELRGIYYLGGAAVAVCCVTYVVWLLKERRIPSVRAITHSEPAYDEQSSTFKGCLLVICVGALLHSCVCTGLISELLEGRGDLPPDSWRGVFFSGLLLLCAGMVAYAQIPELLGEQPFRSRIKRPKPWHAKYLAWPNARIEVDPRGPGRTRLRIGAPSPLPMPGNARLRPRRGQRLGEDALRGMRWVGTGSPAAERWMEHLQRGLATAALVADQGRLAATLSPHGLLVQLPGLVPGDRAFARLKLAVQLLTEGLEAAAAEPPPEGITFTTQTVAEAGVCACCWEAMAPEEAQMECGACGAVQHADCFEWTGGCGRFACSAGAAAE